MDGGSLLGARDRSEAEKRRNEVQGPMAAIPERRRITDYKGR
jgi:hypothetical protein